MIRLLWIASFVLVLTGCATPAPRAPEVVKLPVVVGCLVDVPARPVSTFDQGAWPGGVAAAKAVLADAALWEAYALGLEVAQAGCEKKASTSTPF